MQMSKKVNNDVSMNPPIHFQLWRCIWGLGTTGRSRLYGWKNILLWYIHVKFFWTSPRQRRHFFIFQPRFQKGIYLNMNTVKKIAWLSLILRGRNWTLNQRLISCPSLADATVCSPSKFIVLLKRITATFKLFFSRASLHARVHPGVGQEREAY